ncbi:hypothetical protein BDV26DRAFT_294781 [Aspergillus bertholletiae]|uniref:Uncharacterized protein n=1 Tax=Aspergillus bertholletiae TaxID=1226010 RepID=A0A5N7B0W7_9EURO|nr:hypothetical protein BDV26DRAFT_294781 [Aspergillus bertholletiae]
MSSPERSNAPNNEQEVQPPVDPQRSVGLATVTHTRSDEVEVRRFYFQDDRAIPGHMVPSTSGYQGAQSQEATEISSDCSLYGEEEPPEQPKEECHCYRDTDVDQSSSVFNGAVVDGVKPVAIRKHHMHGGSVKRDSKVVNGDLDQKSFLAFFCGDK